VFGTLDPVDGHLVELATARLRNDDRVHFVFHDRPGMHGLVHELLRTLFQEDHLHYDARTKTT
jgi:hypothetical protein